jgi:chromosome segregation ATPase
MCYMFSSVPRVLMLLAGALIGAIAARKRLNANGAPWRPDLEDLEQKLSSHQRLYEAALLDLRAQPGHVDIAALEARLGLVAQTAAGRLDNCDQQIAGLREHLVDLRSEAVRREELAAAEQRVSQRIEAHANHASELDRKLANQQQSLESTRRIVVALDELLTNRLADVDKRLQAQGRSIDALNTSVTQTDDLLERVLDSIQSLPQAAAEESEAVPVSSAAAPRRR